eukprot:g16771.t1
MGEPARTAATEDRTALHGMGERMLQLVSNGATTAQWSEWLRAPLEHALAAGDKELAFGLLKAGANGDAGRGGRDGRTLLGAAAEGGNAEVVSAVLEAGGLKELDDVSGEEGMTPLHHAIARGHTDAARTLMLAGAAVGLVDDRYRSALHYAVEGGHLQVAGDLVIAGADVSAPDGEGNTPLHLATARGWVELSTTLLRRGASVCVANTKGQHPLHKAVKNSHIELAETLLKAGADANLRWGELKIYSPLYLARCNSAMTKILLKFGADLQDRDSLGCTALHWAGEEGEPDVVDALVEAGADLEPRSLAVCYLLNGFVDFEGLTPLHCAAICGNTGTMASLLRHGADVDVQDAQGLTPLHVACTAHGAQYPRVRTVDRLLRSGADETITDNEGRVAFALIGNGADPSGSLRRLLSEAPADRAWRRRGLLVLCRARSDKTQSGGVYGRGGKVPCRRVGGTGRKGVAGGAAAAAAAAAGDGDKAGGCVLLRVVELETEAIFRTIIGFL